MQVTVRCWTLKVGASRMLDYKSWCKSDAGL